MVLCLHKYTSINLPKAFDTISIPAVEYVIHPKYFGSNFVTLGVKGKSVPLQAWSGPEVSRKLRFPDFMTTAQVIRMSVLRTGRIHPQEILLVLISVRGYVDRKDYVNKKFQ